MKTFYTNDHEHKQLKKRLWFVEVILFILAMLLAGATSAQDATPPQLINQNPPDDRTGVLINEAVSFGFDEPVAKGSSGTIELYNGSGLVESKDVTDASVTIINGSGASVNPNFSTSLVVETDYYVLISDGAFEDLSGNAYAGISDPAEWNFTTMDDESDPPVLSDQTPTHMSTGILVDNIFNDGIYLDFDEDVQAGTGNIEIRSSSDDSLLESIPINDDNVEFSGTSIDIYEAVVPTDTEMYILICNTCITDVIGNAYPGNSAGDWSFTTEDTTPPLVLSLSPEDDATQVAVDQWTYVITFNEDVEVNLSGGSIVIWDDAGFDQAVLSAGSSGISINGSIVTIDFNYDGELDGSPLNENEIYEITIPFNLFQDESGNFFPGFSLNTGGWDLYTVDTIIPSITLQTPPDDQTGVLINAEIILEFDETIQKGSGNLELHDDSGLLESVAITDASIEVSADDFKWVRSGYFEPETNYHIILPSTAITDVNGNEFVGFSSSTNWNFTTMDDETDPPVVDILSPADDETDVVVDDLLEDGLFIQFDEMVLRGTGNIEIRTMNGDVLIQSFDVNGVNVSSEEESEDLKEVYIEGLTGIPTDTELYVSICAGCFTDLLGNAYPGNGVGDWSFTTEITPVEVESFSPDVASTTSAPVNNYTLTFDRDVVKGSTGSATIYKKSDNSIGLYYNFNSQSVKFENNTITFEGYDPLESNTEYYVSIQSGFIADANNTSNTYDGISDNTTWTFTTRTNDGNGPDVTMLSPADGATHVLRSGLDVDFIMTFDEPVYLGSTNDKMLLYRVEEGGDVLYYDIGDPGVISISEDNLEVSLDIPNNYTMQAETEYYILINNLDNTGDPIIYDEDGNGIAAITDENEWRFTTIGNLAVESFSPENGAVDVPVDQVFSFTTNNDLILNTSGTIRLRNYETSQIARTILIPSDDVTVDGNTATINFSGIGGDLTEGFHYYIDIATAVFKDVQNTTFTTSNKDTWNFTTEDVSSPSIATHAPTDDNTNVSLTSNLIINFDENIELGTGNITLYNENDEVVETYSASENVDRITVNFNTITIDPTNDLVDGESYYVLIDNNAVKDDDGFDNFFAGVTDPTVWNFSTPDETAPSFVSASPDDEETNVLVDTDIVLTFDEDIVGNLSTGNQIRLGLASGPLVEAFTDMSRITIDGNALTIDPTEDLNYETEYVLFFWHGAVQDAAGNSATAFDIAFTTEEAPDVTPPSIISLSPADDAGNVLVNTDLIIEFDEDVFLGNSSFLVKYYDFGTNQFVINYASENVSVSGSTITIELPGDLAHNFHYWIQINANTITDAAGNGFPGILLANRDDWDFVTDALPVVTELSPADNSSLVSPSSDLVITFSEDITKGSGNIRLLENGGTELLAVAVTSSEVTVSGNVATISPTGGLPDDNINVYVLVDEGAFEDANGSAFAGISAPAVWNFSILSTDVTAPFIVSTTPADGATDVPLNTNLVIEFNEDIFLPPVGSLNSSFKIKYYNSLQTVQTIDFHSEVVTVNGNLITIDPPMDLEDFETQFWVEIVDNTLEDKVGNTFAGILAFNRDDWDFTTTSKLPQTISFESIADKVFDDDPFQLTATASSGLTVEYSVLSGPVTLVGDLLTITGTGEVSIAADQAGDDNYSPAPQVVQTFTVSKADQTITFDPITDKTWGDADFTISAVSSSGLTVTYSVVSGPISLSGATVSVEGAGVATIAADQVGNDNFNEASQVTQTFTIAKADQLITIEDIPDKLTTDSPFGITASVDSGLPLTYEVEGPASISGTTISLTGETGLATLTVTQFGDDNHNPASSSATFEVNEQAKTDQVITFEAVEDKVFGNESFDLVATASSELTVGFTVVSGPISIDGATVTINGAGEAVVAANQEGNDDFNAADEVTRAFTISKADQTISIEAIPDKLSTDDAFDVSASTDSGLSLDYEVAGPATIVGTTITLDGTAGLVTVTVSQAGNENYNPASESVTFEVTEEQVLGASDDLDQVKFYPNPVTDFLFVDSNQEITLSLYDLNGKVVKQDLSRSGRLDMRDVIPGVYLLEIRNAEHKIQKRIVKAN